MAKSSRIRVRKALIETEYEIHPVCHRLGHKVVEPRNNPRYVPVAEDPIYGFPLSDVFNEGQPIPDHNKWIGDCERCGETVYCDGPG